MRVASTNEPLRLGQPERLRRHSDIRRVFAERNMTRRPHVDVHVRNRGDDQPARVAVVASRKVGSAVVRNRAKRRLRAAAADIGVPSGTDVVLVARTGADEVEYAQLVQELNSVRSWRGRDRR